MAKQPKRPDIRPLTPAECERVLARNHVGRIAFSFHDRVDVQPIHYVYEAGWIYGRTSEGAKLVTLAHNQWMAFEVDEVRGVFDWVSVVVHGSFHRIDLDGPPSEQQAAASAIELLRTLVPDTFGEADPAAFRNVLFRVSVGTISGRLATPGDDERRARTKSGSVATVTPPVK